MQNRILNKDTTSLVFSFLNTTEGATTQSTSANFLAAKKFITNRKALKIEEMTLPVPLDKIEQLIYFLKKSNAVVPAALPPEYELQALKEQPLKVLSNIQIIELLNNNHLNDALLKTARQFPRFAKFVLEHEKLRNLLPQSELKSPTLKEKISGAIQAVKSNLRMIMTRWWRLDPVDRMLVVLLLSPIILKQAAQATWAGIKNGFHRGLSYTPGRNYLKIEPITVAAIAASVKEKPIKKPEKKEMPALKALPILFKPNAENHSENAAEGKGPALAA